MQDWRGVVRHASVSRRNINPIPHAKVAELVDALVLGTSIERCESSSLSFRTINISMHSDAGASGDWSQVAESIIENR